MAFQAIKYEGGFRKNISKHHTAMII